MSKLTSKEVYVLETHRDNIAKANNYLDFKIAQLRFLDYLIKSQKYKDKANDALLEFADETARWVCQVKIEEKQDA